MTIKEMAEAVDASAGIIRNLCIDQRIKAQLVEHKGDVKRWEIESTPTEVKQALKDVGYQPLIGARGKTKKTKPRSKAATSLPEKKDLFSVDDLATLTARSTSHIYSLIKQMKLNTIQNGRVRYLLRPEAQRIFDASVPPVVQPHVEVGVAPPQVMERIKSLENKIDELVNVVGLLGRSIKIVADQLG